MANPIVPIPSVQGILGNFLKFRSRRERIYCVDTNDHPVYRIYEHCSSTRARTNCLRNNKLKRPLLMTLLSNVT